MSHNYKREVWYKEGLLTLISGSTYGVGSIVVGHPMDTVKTKMQSQTHFIDSKGMVGVVKEIWQQEGIRGFYRGASYPLFGSMIFRSLQFSIFESVYTYFDTNNRMKTEIPYTNGVQPRVILGGVAASFVRSCIETPFEYAKVKRQTGQKWSLRSAYKGYFALYIRTTGLMTSYMILIDMFRRKTNWMNSLGGQFCISAISASIAWSLVWPFENLKNVIQAETKDVGKTWKEKFDWMIRKHGIKGVYRGYVPGIICVSTRNGASMIMMQDQALETNNQIFNILINEQVVLTWFDKISLYRSILYTLLELYSCESQNGKEN